MIDQATPLLSVRDLVCHFSEPTTFLRRILRGPGSRPIVALQGVSLDIARGETLALVGESGSGKSTLARCIAGLAHAASGTITFDGPAWPGQIQMIFQDAGASLNPSMRVGRILAEPIRIRFGKAPTDLQMGALLASVGLDSSAAQRFPHEFSGGERQRVAIARAISTRPNLLICDEPTSALDVSTQARVLNLLSELRAAHALALLLLSHDIAAVAQMADRVGVLHQGAICELGPTRQVLDHPQHPYTRALVDACR